MRLLTRLLFVSSLVDEVKALVPIHDDILRETFVRAYIENDPQVHLEICSVLVTRADDFAPPGFGCAQDVDGHSLWPTVHAHH